MVSKVVLSWVGGNNTACLSHSEYSSCCASLLSLHLVQQTTPHMLTHPAPHGWGSGNSGVSC